MSPALFVPDERTLALSSELENNGFSHKIRIETKKNVGTTDGIISVLWSVLIFYFIDRQLCQALQVILGIAAAALSLPHLRAFV